MIRNKRGRENQYMVQVVLVMLTIAALSFFIIRAQDHTKEEDFGECERWIETHVFGKKTLIDFNSNDFPCEREKLLISEDTVYTITTQATEEIIACTNRWHRGERELFTGAAGEQIKFCGICDEVDFTTRDVTVNAQEWLNYQKATEIDGETVLSILADKDFSEGYVERKQTADEETKLTERIVIDTNKRYLIIFTYDKKTQPELWQRYLQGAAIGAGVVIVGGLTVASGGLSLLALGVVGSAAGSGISYAVYHDGQDGDKWISNVELVEFDADTLKQLECDHMVGMPEPGITNRGS